MTFFARFVLLIPLQNARKRKKETHLFLLSFLYFFVFWEGEIEKARRKRGG